MSLQTFIIFLSLGVLIHCGASSQLLTSLREQAEKIAETMPSDYASLVIAINTNGLDGYDACSSDSFNSMIAKYDFSSEIVENFKMVTFSESVEFQAFHVSVKQDFADIIEFIGAGANLGGTIQIAFLQVYAEGTPYPGKQFTSQGLEQISQALRASAYARVKDFLATPPGRIVNYKEREQYLQDLNAWAIEMTKWGSCSIEEGSPCNQLVYDIIVDKCNHYSSSDYDDRDSCIVPYIPLNTYWDPCFLCTCAYIFYSRTPYLPKANQKCFEISYPDAKDIYDPFAENPESLSNIHYWNETKY